MYINSFNFKHSADTFIQGNLYCIQDISLHVGYSLGIEPELGIASVMLYSSNSAIFCQKLDIIFPTFTISQGASVFTQIG